MWWGAGLAGLECARPGTIVTVEREGRSKRLPVRFVVGADGAVSRVEESLGLSRNRSRIVGVEEVFRGTSTGRAPAFHCWVDPAVAPGTEFRARFRTRLLLRRGLAAVRSPAADELACAALRLPPFRSLAQRVFFGRGSFPDVTLRHGGDRPVAATLDLDASQA